MYSVKYLPLAQQDLVEIVTYVAGKLGNPQAARRLASKLTEGAESLATLPYRRRVYTPIRPLSHEYRILRVDNYLMFYWIGEAEQTVTIARVIYAKSDIIRHLENVL